MPPAKIQIIEKEIANLKSRPYVGAALVHNPYSLDFVHPRRLQGFTGYS